MDINEIEEIKFQNVKLSDSATNYELTKENVNEKSVQIFEHYDADKNNKLDKVELSGFRADIDAINADKNADKLSKKEAKEFLGNVFVDKKHKTNELSSFINDVERNYIKTMTTKSDGVVDNFMQGKSGDCWLLSQVSAMAETEWGAKAIKESIIDDKENNKYQIKLNGVGYQVEIGYEEIQALRESKKYSSGDIDMLLLEVGIERYLKQEADAGRIERFENPLDSAQLIGKISVQNLLLGNVGNQFYNSPRVDYADQVQLDATQRMVLDDLIKDKPRIMVMTKYDLCDKTETDKIIKYYESTGYKVVAVDLMNNNTTGVKKIIDATNEIMVGVNNKRKEKDMKEKKVSKKLGISIFLTLAMIMAGIVKNFYVLKGKNKVAMPASVSPY